MLFPYRGKEVAESSLVSQETMVCRGDRRAETGDGMGNESVEERRQAESLGLDELTDRVAGRAEKPWKSDGGRRKRRMRRKCYHIRRNAAVMELCYGRNLVGEGLRESADDGGGAGGGAAVAELGKGRRS